MNNNRFTLREIERVVDPWIFLKSVQDDQCKFSEFSGDIVFNQTDLEDIVSDDQLASITPLEYSGPSNETMESWVLNYVRQIQIKKGFRLVHTVYSGFNQNFRKQFPLIDPLSFVDQMVKENKIRSKAHRKGANLYLMPEQEDLSLFKVEISKDELMNYNYPNKLRSREKLLDFFESNIELEQASVLFLGGFGDEINGYLKRGVAPDNIHVLEKDWQRAAYIKRKFPLVNVHAQELSDFLQIADENKFDSIYLDYDGPLTKSRIQELSMAVRRLKDQAVIGVNYLGRREQEETQEMFLTGLMFQGTGSWLSRNCLEDFVPEELLDMDDNIICLRNYGISGIVLRSLMGSDTYQINSGLISSIPRKDKDEIANRYHSMINDNCMVSSIEANFSLLNDLTQKFIDMDIDPILLLARSIHTSEPFTVREHLRHVYQSQTGKNEYYADLICVDRLSKSQVAEIVRTHIPSKDGEIRKYIFGVHDQKKLFEYFGSSANSNPNNINKKLRNLGDELLSHYRSLFINQSTPPRTRVPGTKFELWGPVKESVIKMIHQGRDDNEIASIYPGVKGSLPGLKQNYKQGRYDRILSK